MTIRKIDEANIPAPGIKHLRKEEEQDGKVAVKRIARVEKGRYRGTKEADA